MGINFNDPLDFFGSAAAESTVESSEKNAELMRTFSDQSQANLQPFLDVSNRALPGLEQGASVGGFFDNANDLRPLTEDMRQGAVQRGLRELNAQLGATGQTRSGFAGRAAADVAQDADLSILLQLSSMITGRQQQVAGMGANTGSTLSRLGTDAAERLGSMQAGGILRGAQAQAQGTQNLIGLAGLGADFLAPTSGGGVPINQSIANNPATQGQITPMYR